MAEPLSEALSPEQLADIELRDEAAGDGHVDYDAYVWDDRHLLLEEVKRLRTLTDQLRQGRPAAN
jgi:hypothetical protein